MKSSLNWLYEHKGKVLLSLCVLLFSLLVLEDVRRRRFVVGSWKTPGSEVITDFRADGSYRLRDYNGRILLEGRYWHTGLSSIKIQGQYIYDEMGRKLQIGTWDSKIDDKSALAEIKVYIPFSGKRMYCSSMSGGQYSSEQERQAVGTMIRAE